jgi:hypothetical protein
MTARLFSEAGKAIVAGVVCLFVLGGMIVLHAWPLWTGQVVSLPVTLSATHDPFRGDGMSLGHAARRIIVGDPAAVPAAAGAVVLAPRGDWWSSVSDDPRRLRRQMYGRTVYVQLEAVNGSDYRPVSISDVPVAGAVNLKGRVQGIDRGSVLEVRYGVDSYYLEEGRARELAQALQQGKNAQAQMQIVVARSGRARIKALFVDGRQI